MLKRLFNAPDTFQRAIDNILEDLKSTYVLVYLDNINVFSKTFDDYLAYLADVFKRHIFNYLKLKPRKCYFFKKELYYLEFIISKERLKHQLNKISTIKR